MLWIITALAVIAAFIFYKINKRYKYWEERGVKYLKPTFFFGNIMKSTFKKESFYWQMKEFYDAFPNERYMGIYHYLTPILIIRDPELIKSIFVKDFDHFPAHRPFVPDGVDSLWSKNLFLLKGAEWRHMRSTLSPAFTASKMRILFQLIEESSDFYISYISKNNITKLGIKDFCTRFTNDTIASVAFGIKTDSVNNKSNDFYEMSKRFTRVGPREAFIVLVYDVIPNISRMLGITLTAKRVREFFTSIITETIKVREEKGVFRPDMISLLLEEKKKMIANGDSLILTDEEIVAQAFVFLFAGFETTSTTLSFCLYELSRNLETQKNLQEEIDDVLKENGGKLNYEALMKMKYIEQVITETLRKWPAALGSDRICGKTYVIEPTNPSEKRIELKPGDTIWTPALGVHRDPKYYPNPDVFDPDRFSDENKDTLHPYTYLPFGLGPRTCIGMRLAMMEVKILLFKLLSKYTLIATSKEPVQLSKNSLDLKMDGEVWVELKPRN